MTRPQATRLLVEADLRLDVEGVQARVTGRGDRVVVTTDHPLRLLRAAAPLARTVGSQRSRSVLTRLSDEGLTVTVVGRRGELAHLGASAGARGIRVVLPRTARSVLAASAVAAAAAVAIVSRRRPRPTE